MPTPILPPAQPLTPTSAPDPKTVDHILVFDTETTGVDVTECRIVSVFVGLMDVRTGLFDERVSVHRLVDPGVDIPEGATAVHGISSERAREFGSRPVEVVGQVLALIDYF